MKKIFICLLVTILSVGIITGCGKKDKKEDNKEIVKFEVDSVSAEKFKNEYEQYNDVEVNGVVLENLDIPTENSPIHYATYDELLKIFDETSIVFFGAPTSAESREIVLTLLNTASANEISRIYYINLNNFENKFENQGGQIVKTVNEQEGYYEVLDKLFNELDEYFIDGIDVGEKRIYAPTVLFIQDGTIIGKYTADLFEDEDAENKSKKISQKFNYYMEQIYSDYCSESC